jgi:hypothetical protein
MSDKKVYVLADEIGNLFTVQDWDRLFEELEDYEIENLYVVQKFNHSIEEAMIELEEKDLIEKATEGQAPLEELANSIDKLAEYIGKERVERLDVKVKQLLDRGFDDTNPANYIHLN